MLPIAAAPSSATTPVQVFPDRHQQFLQRIAQGPVGMLFLGDSITDHWRDAGNVSSFDASFGQYNPANFGVSGDQTQNVLWRITNGELDGINPKLVVLEIGTNNLPNNNNAQIAYAIQTLVATIHQKLPQSKILLLGIFARDALPTGAGRQRVNAINPILSTLDGYDGAVTYMDIGSTFINADGTIGSDVLYDGLHPTAKGYQLWANAIQSTVDRLMQE